jgi:hypothetical protein
MKLARFFHQKEMFLYSVAQWISHTNTDRIQLFLDDENLKPGNRFHALPNYPPQSWMKKPGMPDNCQVKIIYMGALSMETMHTRQFTDWVLGQQGKVSWDIYTNNISTDADIFFNLLKSDYVCLKKGVDYYMLPGILRQYHIGVVLYNGHIPNYVYNAPNKLFEYLACGLDVWVPEEMIGCRPYYTENTYPAVLPVNFRQLDSFNWQDAMHKEGAQYRPSPWYYEQVYPLIAGELFTQT